MNRLRIAAVATMLFMVGCRDTSGPEPGRLIVKLATPSTVEDGAILVEIRGPDAIQAVTAARNTILTESTPSGVTVKVAAFGDISAGPIFEFAVSDTRAAANYTATIIEVADKASALRSSVAGYGITIARE